MMIDVESVLSTFASRGNVIAYDDLMPALGVTNIRELEDILIQALYADVIQVYKDRFDNSI